MPFQFNIPNQAELKTLAKYTSDLCITITFPTLEKGDVDKNRIRFKNAVQELERKLGEVDKKLSEYPDLKQRLEEIERNEEEWSYQAQGFVLLWSKDAYELFKTPFSVPEKVILDKCFYLKDVILHLCSADSYIVLCLNQGQVAMKYGSTVSKDLYTITPPEPLRSLEDFLQAHDFEKSLQFSSEGMRGSSKSDSAPHYHGQGTSGDEDTQNKYLEEYMRHVENWAREVFFRMEKPMKFLLGDDRMCGLYNKNKYDTHPEMYDLEHTNTAGLSDEDIASKVMQAVEQEHQAEGFARIKALQELSDSDPKTITNLEEIVVAAHHGRIKELVVANDYTEELWGEINADQTGVQAISKDRRFNDVGTELINAAITKVYTNGGTITSFDNDNIHLDQPIAVASFTFSK